MAFRNWLRLLAGVVLLALPAAAQRTSRPSVEPWDLLESKIKAEGDVRLAGERQVETSRNGHKMVLRQKVLRDTGDRYRIEYISPPSHKGILFISDGVSRWSYDPRARIATRERLPLRAEAQAERLSGIRAQRGNWLVELGDGGLVARRPTQLLTIRDAKTKAVQRRYWVDRGTLVELKGEVYAGGAAPVQRGWFASINYGPELAGNEFTWRPPAHVHVRELSQPLVELPLRYAHSRVGFTIFNPPRGALPPGFALISDKVGVFEEEEAKVAWLRFTNGAGLFSLFERKRPGFPTPPRHSAITSEWLAGPLHFTLVGQVRPTDANRLRAETIRALGRPGRARSSSR
ncbi:MAG: hypothetical protein PVH68_10585 [Armatimonadota bacterium]|jgi:outer membrane lipoprotein-sorting protein